MEITERIKKARIKLQSQNPFFSYLSLFLDFKESNKLPKEAGMGVNEKGEIFYKKKFIEGLSDDELIGVITHEILHLSLLHLLRVGSRDKVGWNIAGDLVVNSLLYYNDFRLPQGIKPNYCNEFIMGEKVIEKCNEKTAEQIYDELPKQYKQENNDNGDYIIVDKNGEKLQGFDKHFETKLTKEEIQKLKEEWDNRISEAYINAKQRGQLPKGIERFIGDLHREKINWRVLLRKYILKEIPTDFSWSNRSKKSASLGIYLPDIIKEKIKIGVLIDTSGSIEKKELTDFLSEIVGIARAYKNSIDMTLYTHDTDIQTEHEVENGSIDKIMKMEIKGGGGTSFNIPYQTIMKKNPKLKTLIWYTDGYGDYIENTNQTPIIWVLSKNGDDNYIKGKGEIIKLED